MTIKELCDRLDELVDRDEALADSEVTFGEHASPVVGGIILHHDSGARVLNLSPLKLDRIGGF